MPPPFPYAALLSVLLLLLQVLLPFIYSATAAATVAATVAASACASTVLFDYLINGLGRLLRKQTTALFYGWLIKQSSTGRGGGGRASVCLRLGGMPHEACARDFHMTRVTTLPTAAGHGNQIEGGCKGGTRLGRRQMSMSQPKIQKSRAKSDAKKPSKPKKTENREPKTEDTKEPKGDREEMLLNLICERKWLKQILYKYL